MAKIKLTGHASGTGILTVTAPNTSTDRTITLPDETATLSTFDPDGAVTINDTGADVDFRVESSNDANAFFVDGANGKIGLGIAGALGATLHIDPDTNVTTSYGSPLVKVGGSNGWAGNGSIYSIGFGYTNGATVKAPVEVGMVTTSATGVTEGSFVVATRDGTTDAAPAKKFEITADGRGVSQFTAKAWASWNGSSFAELDSHNISSFADNGTGNYRISIDVNMANTNYMVAGSVNNSSRGNLSFETKQVGSVDAQARETDTGTYTDYSALGFVIFGD